MRTNEVAEAGMAVARLAPRKRKPRYQGPGVEQPLYASYRHSGKERDAGSLAVARARLSWTGHGGASACEDPYSGYRDLGVLALG